MGRIAIIDYGMGNLFSVVRACITVGLNPVITNNYNEILRADGVILPGVGSFGEAMAQLKCLDLVLPLKDFIDSNRPFIGICLGMQLLFSESEEFGCYKGMNIFNGRVRKFSLFNTKNERVKVPHMAWDKIFRLPEMAESDWESSLLTGIDNGEFMYFIHSYYVVPEERSFILSMSDYENNQYCSAVHWKNIYGFQFHPEKSAAQGIRIYRNWASIIAGTGGKRDEATYKF